MGMFDYLRVEVPVEVGGPVDLEPSWQTKDGPCDMGTMVITADGRLMIEEARYEEVPEASRPYWGKPEWDENPITHYFGSVNRVVDRMVDSGFHGDLRFYRAADTGLVEYTARFTEGQLTWIRPTKTGKPRWP